MTIQFYLRFHTKYGESLLVSGDAEELGNNDPAKALLLEYLNNEFWTGTINVKKKEFNKGASYKYILQREDGSQFVESCNDRQIDFKKIQDEMKELGPKVEKELKKAKIEIEKAKGEIKEFKTFTDGLESDGLINKKKGFSLKHKDGELFINGKKASQMTYTKYRSFLEKHKQFNIKISDDDFKLDID